MDSRPPNLQLLLLLTSLLHLWQCARGQSSYTIDAVGLTVLPSSIVQSGTPVTLRCQVRVSHNNIPHLTHAFQLTQNDIPVYSSTTPEDSVVYELSPARAADSGNYECRVTVKDKSRASVSQKLNVIGLQTPILYLDNTTPYENEEFTATCSAPEEKGSLIFRFYQKSRTGESFKSIKQLRSTGNSSETKLALDRIGDCLLYCDYEIYLVSGSRHSNHSNKISVIVKGLFPPVMNVLPSSNVYEGDILEVVCKMVSPPKNTQVFLTRDRTVLKQAPVSLIHRFTAQKGDSGELVCKAEWGNVQKETYQTITVKELFSEPHLTVMPKDIFEGDHFELNCSVSIYAPDKISKNTMRFSIYKDNVKLTDTDSYVAVADPSKNGNYTCQAEAASLKKNKTIDIEAKVLVSKPVLSVVGGTLVLGKRFQLLCQSDNGTLPIEYTLHTPNRRSDFRVVSKPWEQAIFNSSAINEISDLGKFLCKASNRRDSPPETVNQLKYSTIIEPVSQPVLTMLPSMGDVVEGQDVTLTCSVKKGSIPINFTWYHREKIEGPLTYKTSEKWEEYYRIDNFRGEHQGEYYCMSTNRANESKQSHSLTIRVKMANWKKGLIAAFCILIIMALILVIIFKKRLPQLRRKTPVELSVKSASTKTERLSLTQAEVNEAANVTPGMIGKSVWSEHVSGSDCTTESDDQNSVTSPEKAEPQYTEVQTKRADPNRAPVKKGTDTVYSEVRNSKQGVPEQTDGGSVEYAQLNHDTDHGNHGDHVVQVDHTDEIDNSVDNNTADHGE